MQAIGEAYVWSGHIRGWNAAQRLFLLHL
jgi:hypothetical protein